MTMTFEEATVPIDFPPDSVPPQDDVEYPCQVCGAESGPYGGRGRKPTRCPVHKKNQSTGPRATRVTGNAATLAAQATAVLVQVNGFMAIASMGLGLHKTGSAIAGANTSFEEAAYQALITDPELCRLILKSGGKSSKLSLTLAYVGFGMQVAPVAVMEMKERKAAREAKLEMENGNED